MNQLTIETFMTPPTEDEEPIEERIIKLFQQLPGNRQEALLEELTQIWDLTTEEDDDE